jgi:predicted transcriptional regulator
MFFPQEMDREPKNRSRVDILANMLKVACGGAVKTRIMYRANLSYRQLVRYLAFLEQRGLIHREDDADNSSLYRVTEKGFEFLREYSRLSEYLPEWAT